VSKTKFKAFITKYALGSGIKEIEAEEAFDVYEGMIRNIKHPWRDCYYSDDWHRTREEAIARAEKMRVERIASLNVQIAKLNRRVAKLEGLKFQ